MRHGHMALIVRLAQIIDSHKQEEEMEEYLSQFGEHWQNFIDREVTPVLEMQRQ